MNRSEAISATKKGAIAACISSTLTIFVVLIAINTDADGKLALFNDPANFIDVFIVLACAWGMYKQSRVASIINFIYFIFAKIVISFETQSFSGLGIGLVFLYFYGMAIKGAFVFHKIEKEENPNYKPSKTWGYVVGIPAALFAILILTYVIMSVSGSVPSTRVMGKNEIRADEMSTLKDAGILYADDKVEYFYSPGFLSVTESGNVMTQDRVVSYLTDENEELFVYEVYFSDIASIEEESPGSSFDDSVYKVNSSDPEVWVRLFLSTEQKGNKKFVDALRDKMAE